VNSALADISTPSATGDDDDDDDDDGARPPGSERPNKDGLLSVLLRRRSRAECVGGDGDAPISEFAENDVGELDEVVLVVMMVGVRVSVRERCTRIGNARGPPGTDGALVISTGRGFGGEGDGGGLVSRAVADSLPLPLPLPPPPPVKAALSFLVLEFLPIEEKKPPATLDPAESGADDKGDPITEVE
jgi:hypothetical protein